MYFRKALISTKFFTTVEKYKLALCLVYRLYTSIVNINIQPPSNLLADLKKFHPIIKAQQKNAITVFHATILSFGSQSRFSKQTQTNKIKNILFFLFFSFLLVPGHSEDARTDSG